MNKPVEVTEAIGCVGFGLAKTEECPCGGYHMVKNDTIYCDACYEVRIAKWGNGEAQADQEA